MLDRLMWWLARRMFPLEPLNDGGEPCSMENCETQRRKRQEHFRVHLREVGHGDDE